MRQVRGGGREIERCERANRRGRNRGPKTTAAGVEEKSSHVKRQSTRTTFHIRRGRLPSLSHLSHLVRARAPRANRPRFALRRWRAVADPETATIFFPYRPRRHEPLGDVRVVAIVPAARVPSMPYPQTYASPSAGRRGSPEPPAAAEQSWPWIRQPVHQPGQGFRFVVSRVDPDWPPAVRGPPERVHLPVPREHRRVRQPPSPLAIPSPSQTDGGGK